MAKGVTAPRITKDRRREILDGAVGSFIDSFTKAYEHTDRDVRFLLAAEGIGWALIAVVDELEAIERLERMR